MDDRETGFSITDGKRRCMKNAANPEKKPLMERMEELGQQYGVKVTDLSERGNPSDRSVWWSATSARSLRGRAILGLLIVVPNLLLAPGM